jgi:Bromodomain
MDLETIERKVKDGSYSRWSELDSDVRLIITNSYTFNPKDTTYHAYTR